MKTTALLAVIALSILPSVASAQGCMYGEKTNVTASSCVEGTQFDSAKGACVPLTTS